MHKAGPAGSAVRGAADLGKTRCAPLVKKEKIEAHILLPKQGHE
jgi:hypothetical protein